MIAQVLRLTRWELFKVRKRWMPWLLLAVAIVVVQATLWGFYAAYGSVGDPDASVYPGVPDARGKAPRVTITCADILDGSADTKAEMVIEEFREDARKRIEQRRARGNCPDIVEHIAEDRERHREFFVLPGGLANALGVAHYIGVFLVMVLGASSMGVEYGWGTLRSALTKGTGRWQFLGAKSLSLVLLSVAGLLVVSLTVTISSLITASLTLDDGGLADAGQWSTVAVMFGKVVYGLVPYAILALFLTVLTASSSMGIAMSLAYYFAELILVRILGGLFDWFNSVTNFLLGANTTIWMTETGVVTTEGGLFSVSDPPWRAARLSRPAGLHSGARRRCLLALPAQGRGRGEGRMIVTVLRLTRWEFFKLRRRWMPWVLVAVAAALCQSFLWSQYYEYVLRVPFHEQSFFGLPGPVVAEDREYDLRNG